MKELPAICRLDATLLAIGAERHVAPQDVSCTPAGRLASTLRALSRAFAIAAAVTLFPPTAAGDDEYRTWRDAQGKYSREAAFIRVEDEHVVLKTREGKTLRVPLGSLSDDDREYVLTRDGNDDDPVRGADRNSYKRLIARHAPSPPYSGGLTEVELAAVSSLGGRLSEALAKGEEVGTFFDRGRLANAVAEQPALPERVLSALRSRADRLLVDLVASSGRDGPLQFVSGRRADGETRLVFRRVDPKTYAPTYFEFVCGTLDAEKPLTDLIVPSECGRGGRWLKSSVLVQEEDARIGRGLARIVADDPKLPEDAVATTRRAISNYREKRPREALGECLQLPDSCWGREYFVRWCFAIAREIDGVDSPPGGGSAHDIVLAKACATTPDAQWLAFKRFDRLVLSGTNADAEEFRRTVLQMQAYLQGDPYLFYYAGLWSERVGDRKEAIEWYLSASALDRQFAWPHYAITGVYLREKDYGRVVEVLDVLKTRFDVDASLKEKRDPRWEPEWAAFETSAEGRRWRDRSQ